MHRKGLQRKRSSVPYKQRPTEPQTQPHRMEKTIKISVLYKIKSRKAMRIWIKAIRFLYIYTCCYPKLAGMYEPTSLTCCIQKVYGQSLLKVDNSPLSVESLEPFRIKLFSTLFLTFALICFFHLMIIMSESIHVLPTSFLETTIGVQIPSRSFNNSQV